MSLRRGQADKEGKFIRKWIPELQHFPSEWIYEPWLAPADVQKVLSSVTVSNDIHMICDHRSLALVKSILFRWWTTSSCTRLDSHTQSIIFSVTEPAYRSTSRD